ncbi:C25 family cysteine peptidase [Planctomycetota bacterium]|nr:C25 family cysteine peptidase [Planctomycetota bacterium]
MTRILCLLIAVIGAITFSAKLSMTEDKKVDDKKTESKTDEFARPVTVLLITDKGLSEAWEPFADWKTTIGKSTKIVTVQAIGVNYKGDDIQTKIRECVLDHVEKHKTKWVILGGDSTRENGAGLVPDRDTPHRHIRYPRTRKPHDKIPTDLYYVSPKDKDWDANDDGIYGDWANDMESISYDGVCAIARIPLRTAEDVAAYTEKIIGYESEFPEASFAKQFMFGCAVPQANYKGDLLWDKNISKAWDGKCQKFLTNKTPWDEDTAGDFQYTPANLVKKINENTASKLHLHGHGHLPSWVLEGHKSVSHETIAKLKNEKNYLILTTVSCNTGEYDNDTDPCIVESILRQPKGGAVAVMAPSRIGVPIFRDYARDPKDGKSQDGTTRTLTLFWSYGLSENLTTGEAAMKAKKEIGKLARKEEGYHWCQCEINLLGDPTLDMRAEDPTTPKVKWPETINRKGTVSLNVGEPGLSVCFWKQGEFYEVVKSNDDGMASVVLDCATAGKLTVAVNGTSKNVAMKAYELR